MSITETTRFTPNLKNPQKEENMLKEYLMQDFEYDEIRVLIFDFDETLYSTPNSQKIYNDYIYRAIQDLSYSKSTRENALAVMEKYGFTTKSDERVAFSDFCEEYFSIYTPDWDEYKKTHFFEPNYEKSSIVSNLLLRKISEKRDIVIVSNEIRENIEYKAQKLGIDLSVFAGIYAPTMAKPKQKSKYQVYRQIVNNYLLDGTEVYAVGDCLKVDIEPILRLGGAGLLTEDTHETETFLLKHFM